MVRIILFDLPSLNIPTDTFDKYETHVIDYIFRELAITYLGRDDLAQVTPDDLRADAIGKKDQQSNDDDDDSNEPEAAYENNQPPSNIPIVRHF